MSGIKRNTVQRQIVLDALKKLNTHPVIEEIYDAIHNDHPSISKATVYRNLRQLAVSGLVRQVSMPDGLERYDGRVVRHYHFKCKVCGDILDINIDYLSELNNEVHSKYGIQVDDHDVIFSGTCGMCSDTKTSIPFHLQ